MPSCYQDSNNYPMGNFISDFCALIKSGKLALLLFFATFIMAVAVRSGVYVFCGYLVYLYLTLPVRLYNDKAGNALLLFSLFYAGILALTGQVLSWFTWLAILLAPFIFYIYGKHLFSTLKIEPNKEGTIVLLFALIMLLLPISLYHLVVIDIINIGLVNPLRVLGSLNADQNHSATVFGLIASISMGGLGAFLALPSRIINISAWIFFASFILSLLTSIHFVNRSGLIVIVSSAVIVCLYLLLAEKRKFFSAVVVIFVTLLIAIHFNLVSSDVIEAYSFRNERDAAVYSGSGMAGGRLDTWIIALKMVFTNPLGWSEPTGDLSYAHNMWLDIARQTGWLPFTLLIWITVRQIKNTIRLFKIEQSVISAILLSIISSILIACMVEPAMEAFCYIFFLLCFIWGMQQQYLKSQSYNE